MSYVVKRYTHGMKRYKAWFLLALLMPGLYLLSAFYSPDQYRAWQDIQLPLEARFASTTTPTVFTSFDEVIRNQDLFFQQNFSVDRYFNLTIKTVEHLEKERYQKVTAAIRNNLSLSREGEIARITYLGKDPELGSHLVGYYARRLLRKAQEGIQLGGIEIDTDLLPKLASSIESSAIRALWRADRIIPMLTLFSASLLGVLVLIAALEWNDATLKSERQIARYVNLPVLGSLPDLNLVSRILGEDASPEDPDTLS
ncbi:hypothetical protein [Desulfoluna sp.]|uniref:hypothetical protein n=1 Tax=Desulfoluna sp. TaxID=2045199 RepID=UPI002613D51C|nr:hypothetical protein [Desulfoluna sp.]